MNINMKLRLKNKVTLLAIIGMVIMIAYTVLGFFGVTPGIAQDEITNVVSLVVELLVMLGVVVDPTTEGVGDSTQALQYDEPRDKSIISDGDISDD